MAPSPQKPKFRRIYRQTLVLIHKNLLILGKAWISTLCRALLFPIAVAVILSVLRNLKLIPSFDDNFGIATSPTRIRDLANTIGSTQKLAFVRNGISRASIDPIIQGVTEQSTKKFETVTVDDPNDLFDVCRQTTQGTSDCFAAVIFQALNATSVEYIIALDKSITDNYGYGNFQTDDSLFTNRIAPLQWAIDSQIGNFSSAARPSTQPFSGSFGPNSYVSSFFSERGPLWFWLVNNFVAPVSILILIGVVYHLNTFVATERETSISELMEAQNVTTTPRILSTCLSFFVVYFPGFLACSIILTQVLFTRTSDILFLFVTLLAGASLIASSHFLASFFGKAQLAGLYASTLAFALALVTLSGSLSGVPEKHYSEVLALSLVFPPITWANFIGDVAGREYLLHPFSLAKQPPIGSKSYPTHIQKLDGYLYIIFFVVQIIAYTTGAYFVERKLWGVTRNFDLIDSTSDVALRCTGLTKTYHGKRPWYWPFMRKGSPVVAINNLDLEVKKGSVTFLLGPNGGGKTTTLKCVAGMTSMDAGSRLELNEGGLVFGICPQSNVFWDSLTVKEHIMIWRKLKTAAFEDTNEEDDDVIGECDLLEKIQARAKTLSGGQMRKLQLAIAFVGGSKVCCIDEASSGLDPLSRRNIWNIIQRGHSRRTILVTTHFLDEADVLADHIAIVYKGKLACEGPGPSLKSQFGEDYTIRGEANTHGDSMVWRTTNSADATRKILELENLSEEETYDVVFPTLEQVFLKVTSESHTAIHDSGGDGIVGEEETSTVIDEKIFALETENARDIDLDVGHSIGLARQVAALFRKRYILLSQKSGWISYGINLIIPIIIAAALVKFLRKFETLQTCTQNAVLLRTASARSQSGSSQIFAPLEYHQSPYLSSYSTPSLYLGPQAAFSGPVQDDIFVSGLSEAVKSYGSYSGSTSQNNSFLTQALLRGRGFVNSTDDMVLRISNSSSYGFGGFGIFAPTPESAILFYDTFLAQSKIGTNMLAFNLIMNRLGNATTTTGPAQKFYSTLRTMRTVENRVTFYAQPIAVLITLAFLAAVSIAVSYPAFERINRVRALHYCNGVSPFALWLGYLLFDTQFIIIQAFFVWGLLFAGSLARLWYEPNYLLGVFILFGIASYLGTYVLSLYTKKAAFAIAAGIHVLLLVLYLVSYVMNQSFGDRANLHETYTSLQYGLGLTSPAANLLRALFIASNTFEILCGKYGDADTSNPFAYVRYGSVYTNLIIQILFLITVLAIHEYASADWVRRHITHRGMPARLHYIVESESAATPVATNTEKTSTVIASTQILQVSKISKFFGKLFAVENVSFNIAANQTLALLGGNGAGKTTVINMIRGELKPNFGDIHLDGISVLKQPHKARLQMGVCPQDDAIDNLTVRQTLNFYATVKGLKNVTSNVDKVLAALNITTYHGVSVKDLSGGTRRKLSVAIALLGNPRILLLDEPSTGQDAGAKRILWKALQDISANRAILLTTHSMEEAEALATNVAIMGTKMLATGTLASLQESHGGAYSVRAVRMEGTTASQVEEMIKQAFEGKVSGYIDSHRQLSFRLPHDRHQLGAIMRTMEEFKGENIEDDDASGAAVGGSSTANKSDTLSQRILQDYVITGPTLEEVFMNVARESGTTGANGV